MLAGLKLFKWKKNYYEITLGADVQGVLKIFPKNTGNNCAGVSF